MKTIEIEVSHLVAQAIFEAGFTVEQVADAMPFSIKIGVDVLECEGGSIDLYKLYAWQETWK
jgi:hypothetical protein